MSPASAYAQLRAGPGDPAAARGIVARRGRLTLSGLATNAERGPGESGVEDLAIDPQGTHIGLLTQAPGVWNVRYSSFEQMLKGNSLVLSN